MTKLNFKKTERGWWQTESSDVWYKIIDIDESGASIYKFNLVVFFGEGADKGRPSTLLTDRFESFDGAKRCAQALEDSMQRRIDAIITKTKRLHSTA